MTDPVIVPPATALPPLPLSLMAASAATRIGVAVSIVAVLWIAIAWAVAQP